MSFQSVNHSSNNYNNYINQPRIRSNSLNNIGINSAFNNVALPSFHPVEIAGRNTSASFSNDYINSVKRLSNGNDTINNAIMNNNYSPKSIYILPKHTMPLITPMNNYASNSYMANQSHIFPSNSRMSTPENITGPSNNYGPIRQYSKSTNALKNYPLPVSSEPDEVEARRLRKNVREKERREEVQRLYEELCGFLRIDIRAERCFVYTKSIAMLKNLKDELKIANDEILKLKSVPNLNTDVEATTNKIVEDPADKVVKISTDKVVEVATDKIVDSTPEKSIIKGEIITEMLITEEVVAAEAKLFVETPNLVESSEKNISVESEAESEVPSIGKFDPTKESRPIYLDSASF